MIRTLLFLLPFFIFGRTGFAQNYNPITVTGFNCDVFAEAPSSLATTSMSMDLSNNVMYTQSFAASTGLPGGVVNSGTIVSGIRTYQLAAFTGSNGLNVTQGNALSLTLTTPASYRKVSLMAFSTESATTINVTLGFTDGSSVNGGNFSLADWFFGAGSVYCCFGRVNRLNAGPYTVSGLPTNPKFFPVDVTLSCSDSKKMLDKVTITTVSGTTAFSSAYILAVSGIDYSINVIPNIVNVTCNGGSDGSAALNVSGSASSYTYSWNTIPVQTGSSATNLTAGTYVCTITDANGCTTNDTVSISEPNPATVTPVANPSTICNGASTQLSVTGLASYLWNPGGQTTSPINVSPVITTTYTVSGTDLNGCSASGTVTVNVNNNPTVSVLPNPVSICNGSSTGLQALGALNYQWSPATGLSSTNSSSPIASPAGTTTYTVTGTNISGCSNTATVTVNVNALPTISVLPNPAVICNGSSVTLHATGAQNYTWSPATGLSSSTVANPSANPTVTTTYTATGTDANGCSNTGTVVVTVNQLPAVNVVANPATICEGSSTQLSESGLTSFTWNPGGQTTSPISVSPPLTATYTVSGTDANGCSGTGTVTVNVHPAPNITIIPNAVSICIGSSTILQANGGQNYTWLPVTGLSNANSSNPTASPSATTTYTVTGTDVNGCQNTATVVVTVNSLPVVNALANPPVICQGNSTQLSETGLTSFTWNPGGQTISPVTVSPVGTITYSVSGTDANGCAGSATVNVTVNPPPVITVAASSQLVCEGTAVTLSATGGAIYYLWNPGALTDSTISVTPSATTVYFVTGNFPGPCTASNSIQVQVVPMPVTAFIATPVSGCDPLTVTFTDQSLNATSWQWWFSDGANSSSPNTLHTFSTGTWDATLITDNSLGCSDTLLQSSVITVYPNPEALFSVDPPINTPIELSDATFQFTNESTGASSYEWNFGDNSYDNVTDPIHTYKTFGNYTVSLLVTSDEGCTDSVSLSLLEIVPNNSAYFPNAFTPNGDGLNDLFQLVVTPNLKSVTLYVFNRWGEPVYASDDMNTGWDGTYKNEPAQVGTYVYRAIVSFENGTVEQLKGNVTLLR